MKYDKHECELWCDEIYEEAKNPSSRTLKELYPELNASEKVIGRYTNLKLLGSGGVKNVYRCYDERTKKHLAYAVVKPELGIEYWELLIREAQLTSSLNHPDIIKIHDVGLNEEDRPFFTMDLFSNTSLTQIIQEEDDMRRLLSIFKRVCKAVAYAHSKGIIHMDLKPDNIQLDDHDQLLVCDWGIGKQLSNGTEEIDLFPNTVKGSRGYLANEFLNGAKPTTTTGDIYALGSILFFILTQKEWEPYDTEQQDWTAKEHLKKIPSSKRTKAISNHLKLVCLQALSPTPSNRLKSLNTLVEAVEQTEQKLKASVWQQHRISLFLGATLLIITTLLIFTVLPKKQPDTATSETTETSSPPSPRPSNIQGETKNIQESLMLNFLQSTSPVNLLQKTERDIQRGLKRNPQNQHLHRFLCTTFLYKLDLKALLDHREEKNVLPYNHNVGIANQYPHFTANNKQRPSINELEGFFKRLQAGKKYPHFTHRLSCILYYDWNARTDKTDYEKVVVAFLNRVNRNNGTTVTYSATERNLTINYQTGGLLSFPESRFNPLAYMNYDTLEIHSPDQFPLNELDQLAPTTLDLRGLKGVIIKETISLPQCENIIASPEVTKELEGHIQSELPVFLHSTKEKETLIHP